MSVLSSFGRETIRMVLPLIILSVGVVGFAAMRHRQPPEQRELPQAQPLLVETVEVAPFDRRLDIEADGLVVPYREISLAAEVAGRVTYKSPECRAGRYVKQGTLLVEIDPQTYELEVQRLMLELEQTRASLAEWDVEKENIHRLIEVAEQQLELQRKNTERQQTLLARKVSTDANLDEALRAELTTRNSLVTLRNELQAIESRKSRVEQARDLAATRLTQAKLDVGRTQVVAPIDGVVVSDSVEQNGYVQVGSQLFTIEDTSAVEVQCNLRMEELRWVLEQAGPDSLGSDTQEAESDYQLPQTPVTVTYRMGNNEYVWDGVLTRYDGIGLDTRTRTVPVRVVVEKPRKAQLRTEAEGSLAIIPGPRALVRGMFVKATIHVDPRRQLLRVPERAVQPGSVVWRVRDGKLNVVPIRTALTMGDTVLLEGANVPLEPDDRVIVSPVAVAIEGMPVREEVVQ